MIGAKVVRHRLRNTKVAVDAASLQDRSMARQKACHKAALKVRLAASFFSCSDAAAVPGLLGNKV